MVKTKQQAKRKSQKDPAEFLIEAILHGIHEKKGRDIVLMNLKPTMTSICDYFVVCHGDSGTQVGAIAHSVEDEVYKLTGERPVYKEGQINAEWVLLDYINIVVHIFLKEQREFYGIERFWADAETRRID